MDTSQIIPLLKSCEGVIPHFYLDTRGLVTIGVGHLVASVDDAMDLPLRHADGTLASSAEIHIEYRAIEASEPARLPSYYAKIADYRMTPDAVHQLLMSDVDAMCTDLGHRLAEWPDLPGPAQTALASMAFALGPGKLVGTYHNLMSAVAAADWKEAAEQCSINGVQAARNTANRNLFLSI